jgi:hypothetical protein
MTHVESTGLDPSMQGEALRTAPPLSPQERLNASRESLQQWIARTYHPERLVPASSEADPPWLSALVESLSDVPVARVAARYLRRWWRRHPLHATAELGDQLGREVLTPTAEKHPWMLLGGAVIAGAVLARLRPWRWVSGSTILSNLLPPVSLASILASVTGLFRSGPSDSVPDSAEEPPAEYAGTASQEQVSVAA